MELNYIQNNIWVFVPLVIWELVWKGLALWKAGRRNQIYWFVAILIVNSAGILPIVYLLINKEREER